MKTAIELLGMLCDCSHGERTFSQSDLELVAERARAEMREMAAQEVAYSYECSRAIRALPTKGTR